MDTFGSLELAWAQGYDGSPAEYITRDILCYRCANNIKFVVDGTEENAQLFPAPAGGIGTLAVHKISRVFAVSDLNLHPTISVFQYPSFRQISELKGGAQLEYLRLDFSTSEYLASISGIPEYELIIWNYTNGTKLCSHPLSPVIPTCVTFNPGNWRELCISTDKELAMWTIEQSNDVYMIHQKKLVMPVTDDMGDGEDDRAVQLLTRASTRMTRVTLDLPMNTVAGVKGEDAERFQEYQEDKERCSAVSHCWLANGDILVGCGGGQLLQVNTETYTIKVLYNPGPSGSPGTLSRVTSAHSAELGGDSDINVDQSKLTDGSLNCLGYHKKGLYAAGDDGVLRLLEVRDSSIAVVQCQPVGAPVTSLTFNPSHHRLALGSKQGSLHIYRDDQPEDMRSLLDLRCGKFVAVDTLTPGTEHCVTVRQGGEVQVWNMENGQLAASVSVGFQSTSLASSPLAHVVAVGTQSGHLYIIDLNSLENPRIVYRESVHHGPVKHILFSEDGQLMLTASDDGSIFVVDARPSAKFKLLGHVDVPGDIRGISCFTSKKTGNIKVAVISNRTDKANQGANKLIHFDLPQDVAKDTAGKHASLKADFKDSVVHKLAFNLVTPVVGVTVADFTTAYILSETTRCIQKVQLPGEAPKKEHSRDSYLQPLEEFNAHDLPGGKLRLSPHQKWLASGGADGKLTIRLLGSLDRAVEVLARDYKSGGVQDVAFTANSHKMLTVGYDGTLICHKWSFTYTGLIKAKSAIDAASARESSLVGQRELEDGAVKAMSDWSPSYSKPASGSVQGDPEQLRRERAIDQAMEDDAIYTTPTPTPSVDATWLDVKEFEALKKEDEQYADVKKTLRTEIRDMRRKIQTMMKENEGVPDIEKLSRHEFDLDVEEQARLQAEGDAEVARIREEKEFENLAKMYLADVIKKECWDDMVVKGRGIMAFNSQLEVHNYPMKKRTAAELEKLAEVNAKRKVEMQEFANRIEVTEGKKKSTTAVADEELGESEENDNESKEKPATTGSLGVLYGGKNELFYNQFELLARQQKTSQIVLLEDAIHRIKEVFNKEFMEVYQKKEQEISKIKEKNKRIRKILDDLDQPVRVYEPEMGQIEKPEMLLTVKDSEVKVEKFYTPEQRKKQQEEKKADEERRQREKADNWRDRGLDHMMGGVLEIKKEDELKKDVPIPSFMQKKPEEEWTEDEKKIFQEYERKVKELNEEREKYRKQLEMELKKLQTIIQDGTQFFDDSLLQLFNKKIKTEMVIYQEELKILRLRYALLQEEEVISREAELLELLDLKREKKQAAIQAQQQAKKSVDAFRETYEFLVAEDRLLDKSFKREFPEVTLVMVDQLYKLFKKRPRGLKGRALDTPNLVDQSSANPFADRPSSSRQNQEMKRSMDAAMAELDKQTNAPEGLDIQVWEHLCQYRREKVNSEHTVKQKALILAEMEDFLKKRQQEDEALGQEISQLTTDISKLGEERLKFTCDLEVQLLMKQGQVEVEAGMFIPSYRDSLLIHRNVVEDLNEKIRKLGELKIASMEESKDFRKGIIQLEWEHQKMTMEMEDLQNKMRDIQNLKVTREIQAYLNEDDYDGKKSREISTLEQTIVVQKQHHEKHLQEKKGIFKDLSKTVRERDEENGALSQELEELNVTVNERRHIHEVNADKRSDSGRDQKYLEIIQRRKLVDLAKAQAQEVAVLRAEVERLRMRTFPALVQVEN